MDKGKKRNLSEVAADYVREQILQGKLAQREKLVENDIAVTLGMSRGPVRDALKQLMYEGFLDYETNKGYSVTMLSPKDAYEIFFLRGNLENLALERCGGRLLSDSIFLMEDAVLAMKEAVAEDDMGKIIQYDEIFAVATFGTVITGLSGTGVRFVVVMYIQFSLVLVHYLFARDR